MYVCHVCVLLRIVDIFWTFSTSSNPLKNALGCWSGWYVSVDPSMYKLYLFLILSVQQPYFPYFCHYLDLDLEITKTILRNDNDVPCQLWLNTTVYCIRIFNLSTITFNQKHMLDAYVYILVYILNRRLFIKLRIPIVLFSRVIVFRKNK